MPNQHNMRDSTRQYPSGPFPDKQQPEPGLNERLEFKPDHGEHTYEGSGRLTGRKALITGGDSGIGRAVAIAYAREGADVAITYLPTEGNDAAKVIQEIRAAGRESVGIPGDLSDELFSSVLVEEVVTKLGGIDILVNNAGKQVFIEDLLLLSTKQLEATFRVNVFAAFWLTKAVMPHLLKGSCIINTTSIQAYQPSAGLLDYAATKAAIANFTKGLAQQLAPKGIRVNGVAPGPVWTPLQPSHGQPTEKLPDFGSDTPLGRAGQPAELAPVYVFLASQESSYITGEIIGVTGGKPIS